MNSTTKLINKNLGSGVMTTRNIRISPVKCLFLIDQACQSCKQQRGSWKKMMYPKKWIVEPGMTCTLTRCSMNTKVLEPYEVKVSQDPCRLFFWVCPVSVRVYLFLLASLLAGFLEIPVSRYFFIIMFVPVPFSTRIAVSPSKLISSPSKPPTLALVHAPARPYFHYKTPYPPGVPLRRRSYCSYSPASLF